MDSNKPILIAAPAWLDAALDEFECVPDELEEFDLTPTPSADLPLGFV